MNRLKKIKLKYLIILISILIIYCFLWKIVPTFMRYYSKINGEAVGYGSVDLSITYELNGGTQAPEQLTFFTSADLPITLLDPTKEGCTFLGWYEESDFSGQRVFTINDGRNHTLYAKWVDGIYAAESNGIYYATLQEAVDIAPLNTETSIKLLKNVTENIFIEQKKNIILDFQKYTLAFNEADKDGTVDKAVISNKGTVYITNGTITTYSNRTGALNNDTASSKITIDAVKIISSSGRQALYNVGTAVIMQNSYLENAISPSSSDNRAAVTNTKTGKLTILGGTIVGKNNAGVINEESGIITIGTNDGEANKEDPIIIGNTYGLNIKVSQYIGSVNFYDGVIKGVTNSIFDSDYISETENGFDIYGTTETIDSKTYQVAYLKVGAIRIKYNSAGGTAFKNKYVISGDEVGTLPEPKMAGYVFDWWYTSEEGGEEVEEERIITGNLDVYAHWILAEDAYVAELNGVKYYSLQDAINEVTDTSATIKLLRTTKENVTVSSTQNIILDLQSHTIRNSTEKAIIENNGTIKVMNGTLRSNSTNTSVINNQKTCTITIDSVKIIARGDRQAFWNNGGISEITGKSYLKAYTVQRAACHNLNSGTMTIKSGTIISTGHSAVHNESGTLTIGVKDGNVNTASPLLRAKDYGVSNSTSFNYYDGDIGGRKGGIEGTMPEVEDGYKISIVEEIFDNLIFEMAHLVPIETEPEIETPAQNSSSSESIPEVIEMPEGNTEDADNTENTKNTESVENNEQVTDNTNQETEQESNQISDN